MSYFSVVAKSLDCLNVALASSSVNKLLSGSPYEIEQSQNLIYLGEEGTGRIVGRWVLLQCVFAAGRQLAEWAARHYPNSPSLQDMLPKFAFPARRRLEAVVVKGRN